MNKLRQELIDMRDEGQSYCEVKTRQGRRVWIDLDTPDPMNMSDDAIYRAHSFWGMDDLETEQGWYVDFDDITEILECKEDK